MELTVLEANLIKYALDKEIAIILAEARKSWEAREKDSYDNLQKRLNEFSALRSKIISRG